MRIWLDADPNVLDFESKREIRQSIGPAFLLSLARASEVLVRLAHSPAEGANLTFPLPYASASLWLGGALVEMEGRVLHDSAPDIPTPRHQLIIARYVM